MPRNERGGYSGYRSNMVQYIAYNDIVGLNLKLSMKQVS